MSRFVLTDLTSSSSWLWQLARVVWANSGSTRVVTARLAVRRGAPNLPGLLLAKAGVERVDEQRQRRMFATFGSPHAPRMAAARRFRAVPQPAMVHVCRRPVRHG